jgi:hypothetical protein
VLATLSRWRSWVQIPSGTLSGTVRKPAKRPSSNLGESLWVRFPPVLLEGCVGWALASLSGCNPPACSCAGSTPARRTDWPVRLSAKDTSPSSWRDGFDSHTGYCNRPSGGTGRHATLRTSCLRAWEFDSPLGHCGVDWSGFQHGLISRSTPVRIRPPQSGIRSQGSGVRNQESGVRCQELVASTPTPDS